MCHLWNQLLRIFRSVRKKNMLFYINGSEVLPSPLTAEQEAEVMRRIRAGDEPAREELITHNLRLVVYIARKFETRAAGIEDLISIGTIGLIKAVRTFQPERNIKLATYASRCIENEILMFLRKTAQYRNDLSIDEPLNVDWDGNELLLSDVLGDRPDVIGSGPAGHGGAKPGIRGRKTQPAPSRRPAAEAGADDYGAAVRAEWPVGAHAERGRRRAWDFAVVHFAAGKADSAAAAGGVGENWIIEIENTAGNRALWARGTAVWCVFFWGDIRGC